VIEDCNLGFKLWISTSFYQFKTMFSFSFSLYLISCSCLCLASLILVFVLFSFNVWFSLLIHVCLVV